MPAVSIGLPVYNGAVYLEAALDSILAQDFTDFEVIISDNASTDTTEEICRRYAANDSRIQYSRLPENQGAARNYNRVFELSSGKYFKWAAHDDVLHPHFLTRCVEVFEQGGDSLSLVHVSAEFIDESGAVVRPDGDRMHAVSNLAAVRAFRVLQSMSMVAAVFGLFRRETLEKTRLIGSFISSDYVLLLETAILGKVVYTPGEPLFQRREHEKMSRLANKSDSDVLKWFDPNAKSRLSARSRLYLEYLKSVFRLEKLNFFNRLVCAAAVVTGVVLKRTRVAVGRWRRQVFARS